MEEEDRPHRVLIYREESFSPKYPKRWRWTRYTGDGTALTASISSFERLDDCWRHVLNVNGTLWDNDQTARTVRHKYFIEVDGDPTAVDPTLQEHAVDEEDW